MEAIFERHGKTADIDPNAAAGLVVAGWGATYGFFQKGNTQIAGESVQGDTAIVTARGTAPDGRAKSLKIEFVREDGLWKVEAGLQSALAP